MFYLSLVLLATFVISTIIYISQLTANLWGTPPHIMEKQRARKEKRNLLDKGISLVQRRNNNQQNKEEVKTETKEEDRFGPVMETNISTKDEKLEVTIISNKKPVLEKIEPQSESEVKTLEPSGLRKLLSCFRRGTKRSVNLPRSDWRGPTACTVKKTVKLSSLRKVFKEAGEVRLGRTTGEIILTSLQRDELPWPDMKTSSCPGITRSVSIA